jgi:hypothetical protein
MGPTMPRDTTRALPPQREAERWNFALLIGIIVAVLVLLPLVIWGIADEADAPVTDVTPAAQVEGSPVADPAASPVVEESLAPQDDAAGGVVVDDGADGGVTDVAPADGATGGAVTDTP